MARKKPAQQIPSAERAATHAGGPVTLAREFESEREYILYVTRQNFRFVNNNGSAAEFAYEKMAAKIRAELPTLKWDKSYLRRFAVIEKGEKDYFNPIHMTMEDVVKLLQVSIAMRDKVEPQVRRAMAIIREAEERWGQSDTAAPTATPSANGPR